MTALKTRRRTRTGPYVLDEQVGFLLRQVSQRHGVIFASLIGEDLTPTQWAALAKLQEIGEPCSQNLLGRHTAMDVATIKGVVDRLTKRGLTRTMEDPTDRRRLLIALTEAGRETVQRAEPNARRISEETLAPLTPAEQDVFLELLRKLR
ncbi:MarR family winged helix-turn-helix transcriptional regulator [Microvirga thermotolerans]|uniref:MarR family transcriptional regulator n=1 Tax=Microvirga thermotolerans TaxID=2651334 RepID=A0A5P9K266_9HYPH|nr:MarR family transcriptional regulator [Microvirga thermotolerans]QFU17725.1 MarR family transcriptional regulator [Microvirga thermotolerans]